MPYHLTFDHRNQYTIQADRFTRSRIKTVIISMGVCCDAIQPLGWSGGSRHSLDERV